MFPPFFPGGPQTPAWVTTPRGDFPGGPSGFLGGFPRGPPHHKEMGARGPAGGFQEARRQGLRFKTPDHDWSLGAQPIRPRGPICSSRDPAPGPAGQNPEVTDTGPREPDRGPPKCQDGGGSPDFRPTETPGG